MKRINTPTSSNGRFVDGNKITGQSATQFSAEWCNMVQEEICNLIKALTGAEPTGQSEEELKSAFLSGVAEILMKSVSVRKNVDSNTNNLAVMNGDELEFKAEHETSVQVNKNSKMSQDGFETTNSNPQGTFKTEVKGGAIHVLKGSSGTDIDYEKISTTTVEVNTIHGMATSQGSQNRHVDVDNDLNVSGGVEVDGVLIVGGKSTLGDADFGDNSGHPATVNVHGSVNIDGGLSPQSGSAMDANVNIKAVLELLGSSLKIKSTLVRLYTSAIGVYDTTDGTKLVNKVGGAAIDNLETIGVTSGDISDVFGHDWDYDGQTKMVFNSSSSDLVYECHYGSGGLERQMVHFPPYTIRTITYFKKNTQRCFVPHGPADYSA